MQPPATAASMNRLFKMAVMAGVESAVRLHIERGDDLDCRDDKGMTPLMIAAARNKAEICRLLLASQADPGLLDPLGRDAFEIAQAAGAIDAALAIKAACRPPGVEAPMTSDQSTPAPDAEACERADDDGAGEFGVWETESEHATPVGDPTLKAAAAEAQAAISQHVPIDDAVDWNEFEAFLPDRAVPLLGEEDAEARERLRLLLLRAIREGSVPQAAVEQSALGDDGGVDEQALAQLTMVLNDLGAEADERFEYTADHESFAVFVEPSETPEEELEVAAVLEFMDDLADGRGDPLRNYQRDREKEALLTAQDEIALGQAMERGLERALDALAAWQAGIEAVVSAARDVVAGVKPLRWLSSGAPGIENVIEVETDTDALLDPLATGERTDDEDDLGVELGTGVGESTDELARIRAAADYLEQLGNGTDRTARRDALASLGLSKEFLLGLTDLPKDGDAARAFATAMRECRLARVGCCRFRGHLVKVADETGGGLWERGGNSAGSSSLRP